MDLFHQSNGVDHDPVTDDALSVWVEDPGRDQVQDILLAVEDDGVSGIGTALIARHDVGLLREHVNDLAFPFIAPLGANDDAYAHCRCRASARVVRDSNT